MSGTNQTVGGLNAEASRMFRVRKTCLKLLQKRGYLIDEESLNMTTSQFSLKYGETPSRENLTLLVEKIADPSDQLFIFFPEDEKLGVKPITGFIERMKNNNVNK